MRQCWILHHKSLTINNQTIHIWHMECLMNEWVTMTTIQFYRTQLSWWLNHFCSSFEVCVCTIYFHLKCYTVLKCQPISNRSVQTLFVAVVVAIVVVQFYNTLRDFQWCRTKEPKTTNLCRFIGQSFIYFFPLKYGNSLLIQQFENVVLRSIEIIRE